IRYICDVPFHDNSPPLDVSNDQIEDFSESNISSIDDDSFSIYKIDYVEASPPDSELVSSEVMEVVIPEISSGSTTTHCDISLPDYEAFYFDDDHIKEISSGSPTTQSDISLSKYDSFIFDFTHEEFVDELAHIISSPEYDCFYFRDLLDPGELMSVLNSRIRVNLSTTLVNLPIEDDHSPLLAYVVWIFLAYLTDLPDQGELMFALNSGIRENLSTTLVNLPIEDDHSPLLAYVVWIFLAYLTYPVIPPYLHPFGNEDTVFDPGITINHFYSFEPRSSHRYGAFKKFNTHRIFPKILPKDFILQVLISSASIGNHVS
nr:hypothetical protein [Tanacetum cinerariifolium]